MNSSVIDSRLFGDLFHVARMRELFTDAARIQRYLDVEAALARAQAKLGVIPADAGAHIDQVARQGGIDTEQVIEETKLVGYPILPIVHALSTAVGEEAGGYVHWGATTQDIMDTATTLQIRDALDIVEAEVAQICTLLRTMATTYRDTPLAGRTHLQHALPVTFGYKAAVWLSMFERSSARLQDLRSRVLVAELSGAAGTLSSLGDDAEAVKQAFAEELDLGFSIVPRHTTRDPLTEIVCTLSLITGSLAKVATDVMIMAMTEVGEVAEPFVSGRGASSTMPQKRNPISCEVVRAAHRFVKESVSQMLDAMEADFERPTGPAHLEWHALPQAFVYASGALSQTAFMLEGLSVYPDRMRENLDRSSGLIMAEAAMMTLAPHLGRQQAHDVVYEACRNAEQSGRSLSKTLAEHPAVKPHLSAEEIADALLPEHYLGLCGRIVDEAVAGHKKARSQRMTGAHSA